jgi:hypothetical protein
MYNSTLSLTSALHMGGWLVKYMSRPLSLWEKGHGPHCVEDWVGHRAGQEGYGKYQPDWDSTPGLPSL